MSTRSILGLMYMVQGLQQLGEDPRPVLARHGLSLDTLDPGTRIERVRELQIYSDLAGQLRDPTAGLKLGNFFGLGGYGPLVMLLMTCPSIYEAFQAGVRYQQLTYLYSTMSFTPGERLSALVLDPLPMAAPAYRLRIDGEIAGTYKMIRDIQSTMGLSLQAEQIDIPYATPAEASAYEAFFGCPVRFGERQARFWIRNDYLQWRLPSADPVSHAMYRQLCDQQLVAQQAELTELSDRVVAHLALFTQSYPNAAEVARSFDMSERTLRRQLSEEGTNFRDLLGQARHQKARHLLGQTTQSIEAIAHQLGYAEAAAFIHAFQRWEGCTPSGYRSRLTA